ncbi:hypothetical protein AB5J49_37640 [Streptomyces sp. R28]|uniref:Uncharacterized protein n=1 Tax=Streptomyces sp. R28 TaxID=3238628 RepID=A0AB39Q5S4_9ACTN
MHRDPSWDPLPTRGTTRLTCQFLLTTVYAPVHWMLCTALLLALLAFGLVIELLSLIPGVERGYEKFIDAVFRVFPWWPLWFVTLPELRHEGDVAFYQARVEAKLAKLVKWKQPQATIPLRTYRAVGAGYVAQRLGQYGWRLQDQVSQRPLTGLQLSRVAPAQAASPA